MWHQKDGAGGNSYSPIGGAAKSAGAPPIRLLSRMIFWSLTLFQGALSKVLGGFSSRGSAPGSRLKAWFLSVGVLCHEYSVHRRSTAQPSWRHRAEADGHTVTPEPRGSHRDRALPGP